jgi:hypothetical protein
MRRVAHPVDRLIQVTISGITCLSASNEPSVSGSHPLACSTRISARPCECAAHSATCAQDATCYERWRNMQCLNTIGQRGCSMRSRCRPHATLHVGRMSVVRCVCSHDRSAQCRVLEPHVACNASRMLHVVASSHAMQPSPPHAAVRTLHAAGAVQRRQPANSKTMPRIALPAATTSRRLAPLDGTPLRCSTSDATLSTTRRR